MILAWSGAWGVNLYNTLWIILIAYIIRYLFFSFRNISAALGQVHPRSKRRRWSPAPAGCVRSAISWCRW